MVQAQTGTKSRHKVHKPHGWPSAERDVPELLLLLQEQQLLLLLKSEQHRYMQVCRDCAAQ